jgi:hypothetical protein
LEEEGWDKVEGWDRREVGTGRLGQEEEEEESWERSRCAGLMMAASFLCCPPLEE